MGTGWRLRHKDGAAGRGATGSSRNRQDDGSGEAVTVALEGTGECPSLRSGTGGGIVIQTIQSCSQRADRGAGRRPIIMPEKLMRGEIMLKVHRSGLGITTHRLLLGGQAGSDGSFSAPLSEIGPCEVRFRPKPWLLGLAALALLSGFLPDLVFVAERTRAGMVGRALLFGSLPAAALVFLYHRSRSAVLTIWIGAAHRTLRFPGGEVPWLREFIRSLHQAREDHLRPAAPRGNAPAPSQQPDSASLGRLGSATAGVGHTRGLWQVPGTGGRDPQPRPVSGQQDRGSAGRC